MVLHARRKKNPANSYIYVFDEPGVFLHQKGQKDLLSVFEQLAQATQIVYATHSLFMLNQNFPERHRLITKSKDTTLVDSKPYRANWRGSIVFGSLESSDLTQLELPTVANRASYFSSTEHPRITHWRVPRHSQP